MAALENVEEKVLASTLLIAIAGQSSANVDRFSGWLLAGYAGAVTILLVNSQSIQAHFPTDPLPSAIYVLVAVLALAIAQKLIAVPLAGAAAAAPLGRHLVNDLVARGVTLDVSVFFAEIERAMIPPMRWLVARSFRKAQAGDLTAAARNISKFGQVQALLVAGQAILVLIQILCVARSLAL